ncbi:zinc transporter ZIP1-like isoform X2 [Neocloeon triangulifer]|uniref:zinc transporter ZIP1-like isoform X2 n=1 Tax=Neocloeon triangulifer TaxID=2078957 RepID=UPI00286F165B|nr:zinc transporter ZIP1-like isoform X2 [Neocloeon triangulifer]
METHEHHEHRHVVDDLMVAKVVAMVVLGASSLLLGVLPLRLAKWLRWEFTATRSQLVLSLLLCFGGGVLFYTTFLHLQPEVREGVAHLQRKGELPTPEGHIHLAELIFCCGFFFVYLVEELVHVCLDSRHEEDDEAVLHRTMSIRKCGRHPESDNASGNSQNLIPRVSLSGKTTDSGSSTQDAEARMTGGPLAIVSNAILPEEGNATRKHHHHNGHSHSIPVLNASEDNKSTVATSFRGLLAVLALSFHAVFEGLAVGLEMSVANVWYLFAAIATHKLVIAFCVGVELMNSGTRKCLLVLYVATFAIVSPLGIGIGIIVASNAENHSTLTPATVVLQGMAAGTLVYVVFFEVLQRERANTQSGFFQLIAIMLGFVIMLCLQLITGHEHSHEDEHNHTDVHHHPHEAPTLSSILPQLVQNMTDKVVGQLTGTTPEVHGDHDHHEHHHH